MNTYNLDLSTWDEGNTQPDLVFNALLLAMDALAQFTPEAITASPPGSPTDGQSWIIDASATGAWAGKDHQVAVAIPGGWLFYPPREGWIGYVKNLDTNYLFNGTTWIASSGASTTWGTITGTLSSQTDLQAALDAKNNLGETAGLNAQTGTTYTLVLSDKGKLVENTNASAVTTTVPPNSSVAFPINSIVYLAQGGAGQLTVAAGSGVTLKPSTVKTRTQDSIIALVKTATNTWRAMGDLA
jgi:hypothetical protein